MLSNRTLEVTFDIACAPQIPFFPPLQQHVEFTHAVCRDIIIAAVGKVHPHVYAVCKQPPKWHVNQVAAS